MIASRAMNMSPVSLQPSAFSLCGGFGDRRSRRGFTLNELLIVIALAVLIVGLALPAFNAITGSRTLESAENQASSYLAAVRTQAIGLQEPRGVIMFEDVTGRVVMVPIYYPPDKTRPEIDLVGGREEMQLPLGIGIQGVSNAPGTGSPAAVPAFPWNVYAVIMFDGDGRMVQEGVRVSNAPASPLYNRLTAAVRTKLQPALASNAVPPPDQTCNIGFVFYDKPGLDAQPTDATTRNKWMQENAIPFLVNRYNGTLLRGE